jgi:hypothetical protein
MLDLFQQEPKIPLRCNELDHVKLTALYNYKVLVTNENIATESLETLDNFLL